MVTKAIYKRKLPGKGNKLENFVIFVPVSRKHVDNFNLHSGLTLSRSHVNGALVSHCPKLNTDVATLSES
jgi:hypothetical protein